MGRVAHFIGKLMPNRLVYFYRKIWKELHPGEDWIEQIKLYEKEVNRLRCTDKPINVVFLVLYASVWKYDSVYRLMEKDPRFNPIILVCPIADYGIEHMKENLMPTYDMFKEKGYNVMLAYDDKTQKLIDIETLNPDILFYAFQWSSHVNVKYNMFTLKKYLKCYVNYSFKNNPYEWSIASREQQMMWMYFSECELNKKLAISFYPRQFRKNIRVVGYPMYDEFITLKETGREWKNNDRTYKRIIWAPHHSIPGSDQAIKLSTFLLYAEDMLRYAEEFKDRVQFAFKPHPQLRPALYKHPEWGKERTDAYYEKWAKGDNTVFVSGAYADLFKSSDGMIHDCHSFTVEYLYVNKPVMFMTNYDRESQCNEVGKKALLCHYQGTESVHIHNFIEKVILGGADSMANERDAFYNEILVPPHGCSVAKNIVNEIKNSLNIN